MEFAKFIEWAFYGIVSGTALFAVTILSGMKSSISDLNNKISIIIEKTTWHEKWLEKHDEDLEELRRLRK